MQGKTEKKLKTLFDFPKLEEEPGLQNVINETISTSSGIRRLSDDELEYAAGGTEINDNKPPVTGKAFCPRCKKIMDIEIFSGGRGRCMKCHTPVDDI